jgi:hypothetical protein
VGGESGEMVKLRRHTLILLGGMIAALSAPQLLPAQAPEADFRVRIEAIDGSRIPGALIALLDSSQTVVREGVSNEDGMRVLRAPAGSYRVRVRRIGFLPYLSDPVSVAQGSDVLLRVNSPRVLLETIVVTSRSKCGPIDPDERILGVVWDEIAKALRTSQLVARDFSDYSASFTYRKTLNSRRIVVSSDTTFRAVGNAKPFGIRDASLLETQGYVVGNENAGWLYYAPDEAVLLSDQFAASHCFQVVRDKDRRGQVGIEFKPVPARVVPDIAGVLWVDERTAELRELIFRYVNAGTLERFKAGGFARFRRVPSGSWIVDSWALSGPILEKNNEPFGDLKIIGYVEDGGGLKVRVKP